MHTKDSRPPAPSWRRISLRAAVLSAFLAGAVNVQAQSVTIFGSLGNFDAANNVGQDAHGFEIQLEGIQASDIVYTWPGNKYGQPVIVPYATGVYVRYVSPYNAATQSFPATTVPIAPGTNFGGTCYMGTATYLTAGCDHFGVHLALNLNPTATNSRWLVADPQVAGTLTGVGVPAAIVAPVWTVVPPPPTNPTAPPTVVAEINAPEPPQVPGQYGDATWVKVYKTELTREVALDELTTGNTAVVPQDPAQLETAWKLIQQSPPTGHKQRGKHANSGSPNSNSRSIVRRYETYAYTGAYDPLTHEALCGGDGTCNAPLDGELGDLLGAQMAAINIGIPSLAIARVGNGNVNSTDKVLSCGSKCSSNYPLGTAVALVASPASGNVFAGWTGACSGTQLTCNLTVTDSLTATATFIPQFTLSIGRSGSGTVTGTPSGIDRAINCGSACSAKFSQATVVTLTATPAPGLQFVGWSGACSGMANVCSLSINKDTTAQANFK
jgi:uncharacterized repeat protein (TIGR02543 family)